MEDVRKTVSAESQISRVSKASKTHTESIASSITEYDFRELDQPSKWTGEANSTEGIIKSKPASCNCISIWRYKRQKETLKKAADKLSEYKNEMKILYDKIRNEMKWPTFPGNEQKKVSDYNYLSNILWIISYAMTPIGAEDVIEAEIEIKTQFEEVVKVAEGTGKILRLLFKPLIDLFDGTILLHFMHDCFVKAKIRIEGYRECDSSPLDATKILFNGNHIQDFKTLSIYTRDPSHRFWKAFIGLPFRDRVSNVIIGMTVVVESLKKIQILLIPTLKGLKRGKSSVTKKTFLPHIRTMFKAISYLTKNERLFIAHSREIILIYKKARKDINYILTVGRSILISVWEVLLMVRLSYSLLREGSDIPLLPYDTFLSRNFEHELEHLMKRTNFQYDQFFQVSCPDVLRKVPVILSNRVELALHIEGHVNAIAVTESSERPSLASLKSKMKKTFAIITKENETAPGTLDPSNQKVP